jgi:hypothetical protein
LLEPNAWKFNQSSAFSLNPPPSVEQLQCLPELFYKTKRFNRLPRVTKGCSKLMHKRNTLSKQQQQQQQRLLSRSEKHQQQQQTTKTQRK